MAKINVKGLDLDLKQLDKEELSSLISQIKIAGFDVEIVNEKLIITSPLNNKYFNSIENNEITIKELKILIEGQNIKAGELIDELIAKLDENNQEETLLGQNVLNDKNIDNIVTAAGPGNQNGQRNLVKELIDTPKEKISNNLTYERIANTEIFAENNNNRNFILESSIQAENASDANIENLLTTANDAAATANTAIVAAKTAADLLDANTNPTDAQIATANQAVDTANVAITTATTAAATYVSAANAGNEPVETTTVISTTAQAASTIANAIQAENASDANIADLLTTANDAAATANTAIVAAKTAADNFTSNPTDTEITQAQDLVTEATSKVAIANEAAITYIDAAIAGGETLETTIVINDVTLAIDAINEAINRNDAPILNVENNNVADTTETLNSFKVSTAKDLSKEFVDLYTSENIKIIKDLALELEDNVTYDESDKKEVLSESLKIAIILNDFKNNHNEVYNQIRNATSSENREDFKTSLKDFENFTEYNKESIAEKNNDISLDDLNKVFSLMSTDNISTISSIMDKSDEILENNPTLKDDIKYIENNISNDEQELLTADLASDPKTMETIQNKIVQDALNDENVMAVASNNKIVEVSISFNNSSDGTKLIVNNISDDSIATAALQNIDAVKAYYYAQGLTQIGQIYNPNTTYAAINIELSAMNKLDASEKAAYLAFIGSTDAVSHVRALVEGNNGIPNEDLSTAQIEATQLLQTLKGYKVASDMASANASTEVNTIVNSLLLDNIALTALAHPDVITAYYTSLFYAQNGLPYYPNTDNTLDATEKVIYSQFVGSPTSVDHVVALIQGTNGIPNKDLSTAQAEATQLLQTLQGYKVASDTASTAASSEAHVIVDPLFVDDIALATLSYPDAIAAYYYSLALVQIGQVYNPDVSYELTNIEIPAMQSLSAIENSIYIQLLDVNNTNNSIENIEALLIGTDGKLNVTLDPSKMSADNIGAINIMNQLKTLTSDEVVLMNNLLKDDNSMVIINALLVKDENNHTLLDDINDIPTSITDFAKDSENKDVLDILIKLAGNEELIQSFKDLSSDSKALLKDNETILDELKDTANDDIDFTKAYKDALELFDIDKNENNTSTIGIDLSPAMIAYYLQIGKIIEVGNKYVTNNPDLNSEAIVLHNFTLNIASSITLSDSDNITLQSAKIIISDGLDSNDLLLIDTSILPVGITTTWDATTGTLSITGEASVVEYKDILSNIIYTNSSSTSQYEEKIFEFTVNDGKLDSIVSEIKINESNEITYDGSNVDGETGYDSLIFGSNNTNIDISALLNTASIQNIEEISLTDSDHILANISLDDVIAMSDNNNTLKITSDNTEDKMSIDTLETNRTAAQWAKDTTDDGSDGYITYTGVSASNEAVTLLVDKDITVTDI